MVTVVTIILAVGSVSKIPSQSSQPSHTPKRILRPRRSIRRLGPVSLGENIFQAVDGSGAVREYGNAGVHAAADDVVHRRQRPRLPQETHPPRRAHDTLQPQDESIIVGYYTLKKCRSLRFPNLTAVYQQKGALWQETTGLTVP